MAQYDDIRRIQSRLAGLHKGRHPDPGAVASARQDLAEAKIAKAIMKALDEAPPLSKEQRDRLAALFAGRLQG